jgi:sulfoxide reductase heme-binding subunit YedZ
MMEEHAFWYLTRATGLLAFVLLTVSLSLGLLMTGKATTGLQRSAIYDLHRFVALLTLTITLAHTFIVLPDKYIGFSVWELLVPFASPYRPDYMALGTLALYVMAVVVVSFYLRPLVPYRAWRALHYATFGVFAMALAHGIGAGSDTGVAWAQGLYVIGGGLVVALGAVRLVRAATGTPRRQARASFSEQRPSEQPGA